MKTKEYDLEELDVSSFVERVVKNIGKSNGEHQSTVSHRIQETDFPILGPNVSYKSVYFQILDSFLKHATKLKFLQVENFLKTLCCRYSVWSGT